MKNTIKIAVCLFLALNVNGQTIPLASYNYPNGAYLKDLNNEMPYWEGTWEGTLNNRKYTFVFTQFIHHLNGDINSHYYYRDVIRGKYQVLDLATNQVVYDNLAAINYDDYSIHGIGLNHGNFSFWFKDIASKCNNSADFILQRISGQPNQVKYCYFRYGDYSYFDCTNYTTQISIPMFLPQENLILTKR